MKNRYWKFFHACPWRARLAILIVATLVFMGIFAPLIAPYGESAVMGAQYEPWSSTYLLGTDQLGRDFLSRLIYGARNSIGLTLAATVLAFLIGVCLALLCAVLRGWVDQVVSRFIDVVIVIPQLIFALILISTVGASVGSLIVIIGCLESTRVFRVARAAAMDVASMDYMEAARLQGESLGWQMFREILPNIAVPLLSEFGIRFCIVFLMVSTLSFLGIGIQPPTADWASMVRENSTLITYGDLTPLLPALAIALLTISINVIVDWVLSVIGERDA